MTLGAKPFAGRQAVLATMHGKEAAIASILENALGLSIIVPQGIDTDTLGTFTGEIARPGNMDEVLIAKARLGLSITGLNLAIASEGSYGPHPHIPFIPAGLEKLVLVDQTTGLIAMEHVFDDAPSYHNRQVKDMADLADFPVLIGFPAQALIVKPSDFPAPSVAVFKGLRDLESLACAIKTATAHSRDGLAQVETDMRAHMNPARMATLARLTERFAGRLLSACKACDAPGWGVVDIENGLPCSWCGGPTNLVRSEIYGCFLCDHREKTPRTDGLQEADPGSCPYCNP
ncbi:DUF6671 family protein [Hyphomonas sp.]|uniref:DUF6671 family protein n=1 Tax=Hyphomonas sp. TaxID=87 RepID=UPI00356609FD